MKNFHVYDRFAFITLSITIVLGVMGFIPGGFLSGIVLKGYLLIAGGLISLSSWLLGRLFEGKFRIAKSPFMFALLALVVVYFISALFSSTPTISFLGEGFGQMTFALIAIFSIILFLASNLFSSGNRTSNFLMILFFLYAVLAVYQLVHLFFPSATALGVFFDPLSTPVGTWGDFAFLSGAVVTGCVLVLEFLKTSRLTRILTIILGLLALFYVSLANIMTVWVLLGISMVLILIYKLVISGTSEKRHFPATAFIVTLVALLYILANNLFGGVVQNLVGAGFLNVNPSFEATVEVAKHSLAKNPITGVGPNRFFHEWVSYRPLAVNEHSLWDVPFSSGVSFFMTLAILGGGLGILACILFLLAFGYESLKRTFVATPEQQGSAVYVFSMFILALYFVLSAILFSPGVSVVLIAFVFMGLFFASLSVTGRIEEKTISFLKDQRASFFSILCIVFVLLISVGTFYGATERFVAQIYFGKGLNAARVGDIQKTDKRFSQAVSLSDLPTFQRARVLLAEQTLQNLINDSESESMSEDVLRTSIQQIITAGSESARRAIALDPRNPENYLVLGSLMRKINLLKVEGSFDAAKDAYERAIVQAPNYPKSYLAFAELYFEAEKTDEAHEQIALALSKKKNYTDAYYLLAQIEVRAGKTAQAIQKLEDATLVDPNNPNLYFQLGILRYQNKNYTSAASAFESAVARDPSYLNAWYFLALSHDKAGKKEDSLSILRVLHERLPDNEEISRALSNVENGLPAESTSNQTKNEAPTLPVDETEE